MKPSTATNGTTATIPSPRSSSRVAERRLGLVADTSELQEAPGKAEPLWQPLARSSSSVPTTDEVLNAVRPPRTLSAPVEQAIIATLTRELLPGETLHSGNANRERELLALFAPLKPVDIFDLRRRLDRNSDNDAIAVALRRLIVERRERIKAFLADPRRRISR